eukprot:TRINITY_DN1824_c0_g1_i2.p3 TRINITY_DN1824_c0_g1~~TRINITY_DN1824_c0_g1_i2.p3  ORF type:complete len:67 (+),score=9.09 TRINITY_DN1824_c0_g1_i2:1351-1551(+)
MMPEKVYIYSYCLYKESLLEITGGSLSMLGIGTILWLVRKRNNHQNQSQNQSQNQRYTQMVITKIS